MIRQDFLWEGGPSFYFDTELFPPSTDSFALGYFAAPKSGSKVCDLGCGTGLLGALLMARNTGLTLHNVELQERALALAGRTFAENGWQAEIALGDLRDAAVLPAAGTMDYAVSNPPYFRAGSGASAPEPSRQSAREESNCTIADVCTAAARVLRWGGSFAVVYRPERLVDLLVSLRAHGMEPKRLRFVQTKDVPSLVLVESRRGGKPGLTVEPPLIIGSGEWEKVYFR
ncbi:MAG: methyltransferase [Oscillospiraceae bacterium]|nr:methyltransferase [Oscillospiraceae bacterium]